MILADVLLFAVVPDAVVDRRVQTAPLDLVSRAGTDDWFSLGERWPTPRVRYADLDRPSRQE